MITIHISWSMILFVICGIMCFYTSGVFFVIALAGVIFPVLKYIHDIIMYSMVGLPTSKEVKEHRHV